MKIVTQSILVPKDKYNYEQACEWVDKHGFKKTFGNKKKVDETESFFRFRQKQPSDTMVYGQLDLNKKGVQKVIMYSQKEAKYKIKKITKQKDQPKSE